jgi:hypothetical protein
MCLEGLRKYSIRVTGVLNRKRMKYNITHCCMPYRVDLMPYSPVHLYSFRLMRYVTNREVAGSRPDEVNDFYQVT